MNLMINLMDDFMAQIHQEEVLRLWVFVCSPPGRETQQRCPPTRGFARFSLLAQGDAFPYEKARIIAELELSMTAEDLANPRFFPKWLHVLAPKNISQTGSDSADWQGQVAAISRATERVLLRQSHRLDLFAKNLDEAFKVRARWLVLL